jgi:hypothetical protein
VRITNGQEIASSGRNREVEIKMQGYVFRTNLFILPMTSCDIVLGIQWLRTLGPILWDFIMEKWAVYCKVTRRALI